MLHRLALFPLLSLATVGAATVGEVMAADFLPRAAPATPAPAHDWTGGYVGVNAGAATGLSRRETPASPSGGLANGAPVRDLPPSMSGR